MDVPGQALLDLCRNATKNILLVAPFIKVSALVRVLEAIPEGLSSIRCVTRWRPEEIAAGVSDLEVFDILSKHSAGRLFLHPYLHAKYFRADDNCLVGSSNITLKGLGWATPANFELLIPCDVASTEVIDFETLLFTSVVEATETLKNEMLSAVKCLDLSDIKYVPDEETAVSKADSQSPDMWLPLCTRPELLYQIYSGVNIDHIVGWTLTAGQRDIDSMGIPPSLSRGLFQSFVAAFLQQLPFSMRIFELAQSPIYPPKGHELITAEIDEKHLVYGSAEHWSTMRNWLLYFLPHLYRQPAGSDAIQRGAVLGTLPT